MNYSVLNYILLFSAATVFVGVLTPLVRKIALRKGIFDQPNSTHKTHTEPIPYLGGVAIIIGVITLTFASTALVEPQSLTLVAGVLLPCLVLGLIGLFDDLFSLAPWPRLVAQTLVGIIVAVLLIRADTVGNPTGSKSLDILLTILFIVGLSNSINFFDNVDGGASGTIAISSIFLAFLAYTSNQFYIAAIATVLAGATIGFLKWNRSPARIYMGDAGSLFLGSLMASLLVRFEPNPISYPTFFFVPLFLIAVPLLDTSVAVLSRILRGVSPLQGGRDHLSHRLMRLGMPKVKSVVILWLTTALFGAIAVALSNVSYRLEPAVTTIGSLIWISAFIYFFRIPATDALMNKEKLQ